MDKSKIKLYSENNSYKLYQGNMLDMLEVIESNSIDSIVTDPPYGLTSITKRFGKENSVECQYGKDGSFQRLSKGFMGKEWDGSGIEYNIDTWKKCYEVLKEGGYLLAFGGTRTFHRIACAIEDAGFEIRDTIMWLYGSGFPKSMDISKKIDKKLGNGKFKNKEIEFVKWFKKNSLKEPAEIDKIFGWKARSFHFFSENDNNRHIPNWDVYVILKKECGLSNEYDDFIKKHSLLLEEIREVQGYENSIKNWNKKYIKPVLNEPSTDLAKQWQGWGTSLKPSFEPIIVARKPFKGSLVDNVIKNGVGGINVDECRVESKPRKTGTKPTSSEATGSGNTLIGSSKNRQAEYDKLDLGRFPANTILTYDETDFEEVCGGFPNTKTGDVKPHKNKSDGVCNFNTQNKTINYFNGDSGSASRYFYCAKASKRDRDEGLEEFDKKINCDRNVECYSANVPFNRSSLPKKNTHPTVKPTDLMQYLVRLVTPNGGTILDPFNGSGSTGKAVMYENLERGKNYKYIGIELTEEYLPISKARIEYVCNKEKQFTIDDILN